MIIALRWILKVKSDEHSDVRSIRQGFLLRVIIERRVLILRNCSLRMFLANAPNQKLNSLSKGCENCISQWMLPQLWCKVSRIWRMWAWWPKSHYNTCRQHYKGWFRDLRWLMISKQAKESHSSKEHSQKIIKNKVKPPWRINDYELTDPRNSKDKRIQEVKWLPRQRQLSIYLIDIGDLA